MRNREGFTLIEMLVVIGIIVILLGASIGGFSKMTKSAERAKAQELVANAATSLTVYFQKEGCWPKRIITEASSGDGRMNEDVGAILAKKGLFSLSYNGSQLTGADRFGIVSPWAAATIKRLGDKASESTKIQGTQTTVKDHVLHFAVDLDGDGVTEAKVGGETVKIRATAAVWCIGKKGGDSGTPWPYAQSSRHDDVYSWTLGQTKNVK